MSQGPALGTHLGHIKGHLHVTHRTEIVDFVGLRFGNDGDKVGGVTKITVMKEKLNSSLMSIFVNVVNTASVERG